MRTLFSHNILSPQPTPAPSNKPNPFELSFHQSSYATSSTASTAASNVSSQSTSPKQNDYLTQRDAIQQDYADDVYPRQSLDAVTRYGHTRRKGNPKVLFMGMRRLVEWLPRYDCAMADRWSPGVGSPQFRKSCSRSCLLQKHSF